LAGLLSDRFFTDLLGAFDAAVKNPGLYENELAMAKFQLLEHGVRAGTRKDIHAITEHFQGKAQSYEGEHVEKYFKTLLFTMIYRVEMQFGPMGGDGEMEAETAKDLKILKELMAESHPRQDTDDRSGILSDSDVFTKAVSRELGDLRADVETLRTLSKDPSWTEIEFCHSGIKFSVNRQTLESLLAGAESLRSEITSNQPSA
jgi:hypothetical protein